MGATLVNTATVTSSTFDAVLANNTATATSHTPGVNPSDTDNDGLPNDWETRFGLDPDSGAGDNGAGGDPDGDGRTNLQELHGGLASARLRDHVSRRRRDRHVLRHAARARQSDGARRPRAVPLPEGRRHGRVGLRARCRRSAARRSTSTALASMASAAFSTLIEADVQVVADRTMTWGVGGYGSHAERGMLTRTATTWYLAEGATHGSFNLFYLIQNPGPAAAAGRGRLPAAGAARRSSGPTSVARNSRFNHPRRRRARAWPRPTSRRRSARPTACRSSSSARCTSRGRTRSSRAGHESAGVTAPATRWFLAEGATGVVLRHVHPDRQPEHRRGRPCRCDYLLTDGQTITRTHTVGAGSRADV